MNKYEKYKKVNLLWLQEVPEHWEIVRLSNLGTFKTGGTPKNNDGIGYLGDYPWATPKDMDDFYIKKTKKFISKEALIKNNYKLFPKGSILMVCIASIGKISISTKETYSNQQITAIIDILCNNRFLKYSLLSQMEKIKSDASSSVVPIISTKYLKMIKIPLPPLAEQEQIASYLDWKINEIEKLIEVEQKKIKKLQSLKRKTLIDLIQGYSNKVKKTLDNNDIPEISFVPIDADIVPLFSLATENKEKNEGRNNNLLSLSYGNIIRKSIMSTKGLLPENFNSYQMVHEDMVILRLTDLQNDQVSLRTGYVKETGIITSAYVGLIPNNKKILGEYLQLLLHSYDILKVFYRLGTGLRQSLGYKDLKRLPIILPHIEQQKKLVNEVHNINNELDTNIENLKIKIEVLKKFKHSLISEVVTGKIDVRGVVIPKYEKIDTTIEEEDLEE